MMAGAKGKLMPLYSFELHFLYVFPVVRMVAVFSGISLDQPARGKE